jgi:MoaA/NifB/PqqE/SkfB family radical SAM enzyme
MIENRCNLKCKFCGIWRSKEVEKLSTEEIKDMVDKVDELGICYISITGGEPLLRKDIEEIADYISRKGIMVGLTTNGTLLTDKRAEKIAKSFDYVRISVHGTEEAHDYITGEEGTYKRVIENIKNLTSTKDRKARIGINFVITTEGQSDIEKLYDYAINHLNVDFVSFIPVNISEDLEIKDNIAYGGIYETIKGLKKKEGNIGDTNMFLQPPSFDLGRAYCDAGKLFFSILPNGDITICQTSQFCVGNIKKDDLIALWKSGEISKTGEIYGRNCEGCYLKCTTELSFIFRSSPLKLLLNLPDTLKSYKLRR